MVGQRFISKRSRWEISISLLSLTTMVSCCTGFKLRLRLYETNGLAEQTEENRSPLTNEKVR